MDLHPFALATVPLVFVRLVRRPRDARALAGALRDLLTLWLVLRGTDPAERGPLLRAHRSWRLPDSTVPAVRRGRRSPGGR
ncbi:hypothetical protein HUT16_17720 [Kitasatospora sp. NA04385]|uniref:hypothetical protein n=1 Tax=Kitasatospora sp. NA04385 TaxID=2742135 RepID=UPI001592A66D|nr:hypothetical protein [Kitasatospora sp. NA04385]QKW20662.1 hypothetical protein HUT16_17720 [Kitasatospora sp. NA04385]